MPDKRRREHDDIHVRLAPDLGAAIRRVAADEHRTVGGQIEYVLDNWINKESEESRDARINP